MCEAVERTGQTDCLVDNSTAKGEAGLLHRLSMRPYILVPAQGSDMCLWQERNTSPDNKALLSAQLVKKNKLSRAHTEKHHLRERKVSQAKNVTPLDHQMSKSLWHSPTSWYHRTWHTLNWFSVSNRPQAGQCHIQIGWTPGLTMQSRGCMGWQPPGVHYRLRC